MSLRPAIVIGFINVTLWVLFLRTANWWMIGPLALCALAVGRATAEKPWFTVVVLCIAPLIMAGGERHGQPWMWLVHPLLWPYFLEQFFPIYASYIVLVAVGQSVRRAYQPLG